MGLLSGRKEDQVQLSFILQKKRAATGKHNT